MSHGLVQSALCCLVGAQQHAYAIQYTRQRFNLRIWRERVFLHADNILEGVHPRSHKDYEASFGDICVFHSCL